MIHLGEALGGARFLASLPRFLRRPITLDEARTTLQQRLERRADDFLQLAREVIFRHPTNPYRQLFVVAGCEYGDLDRMVRREGVETALGTLVRHGVYLTVDEFKGRRPIVRGSTTIVAEPAELRDPAAAAHLPLHSGGSRGTGSPVSIDLAYVRDRAVDSYLAFHAVGGDRWQHAVWGVPGGSSVVVLLEFAAFGGPVPRWFSQIDPRLSDLHPRYRWSARVMRWGSLGAPARLPALADAAGSTGVATGSGRLPRGRPGTPPSWVARGRGFRAGEDLSRFGVPLHPSGFLRHRWTRRAGSGGWSHHGAPTGKISAWIPGRAAGRTRRAP